jgi:hypothetical protein
MVGCVVVRGVWPKSCSRVMLKYCAIGMRVAIFGLVVMLEAMR